ncbi:hypothetical protein [Sedimentibacter sp.]|uniref:hypothetical protein n=1 Tax=Sedimentibacter sp. TaxID=1960295 RepID=UPI00289673BC|nr:hypothetical protein [Sedimentibacter sp.]
MKFERRKINSENYSGLKIEKESFTVIKVNIEESDKELLDYIKDKAGELANNANSGAANGTNSEREYNVKYKDALSGLLAENACILLINLYMKRESASATEYSDAKSQIDIMLENNKTIEVRSSCMRNGLEFCMFAKKNNAEQYFDIIGPYNAEYKPDEPKKDYYMRVLYPINKINFVEYIDDVNNFEMYIVNGATWNMMCNDMYYRLKNLKPNNSDVDEEGNYRVIPVSKGIEILPLLRLIKNDIIQ